MILRQRDIRTAYYYLERDKAARARDGALWMMVLAMLIAGLVLFVNMRIAPALPASAFERPTPTPKPTFDLSSGAAEPARVITDDPEALVLINPDLPLVPFPTATAVIAPTATLRNPSSANQVLRPQAQPTRPTLDVEPIYDGCDENINIEQPPSGETVAEGVSLFGRAVADNFDYYIIQVRGPETSNLWVDLIDGTVNSAVENGFLGSGRFAEWRTGIYQIELSIIDQEGNAAGSCRIQIGILN